jgi:hypothetical protein
VVEHSEVVLDEGCLPGVYLEEDLEFFL